MLKKDKIILDLCGGTGSWSKPYKVAGYRVMNITLPKYNVLKHRFTRLKRGVFETTPIWCKYLTFRGFEINDISVRVDEIYGVLAAPPCTKFSLANWRASKSDRDFKEGMSTVRACMDIIWTIQENGAPLKFWALENPLGYLYNFLGKPAFYFQPWQFGEKGLLATKRTALWGYFNQPATTVRVRKIPYVRTHSINKKDKNVAIEVNRKWGSMSREDRAATSPWFAKAFYKANK